MELPALATLDELAGWMQVEPDDLPDSAGMVLDIVSAIVRAEARQTFTRRTSTAVLYPDACRVSLPQRPVVSVESVTDEGGSPLAYRLRRDVIHLDKPAEATRVTFTHGYSKVPGDVLAVALTAAQRVVSNPRDYRQETVGAISVTYAAETIGASLSQADRDLLARYRRTVAVVKLC
ncbi:hypothetical protein AB0F32_24420 [Streptomyces albidoflavus]|uniref:hypothetical protein n=1 Tax=Streptomyces albidoflavus TaxID=1886 RepID=UPI003406131F